MCCSVVQPLASVVIMTLSDAQGDASLKLKYRNVKYNENKYMISISGWPILKNATIRYNYAVTS